MVITKETWENIPDEEKLWIIFNTVQELVPRVAKLEGRKVFDKGLNLAGGIIGGALAFLGLKVWR